MQSNCKAGSDLIVPLAVCYCSRVFVCLLDTQRCCSPECREEWTKIHGREPDVPKVIPVVFRPCGFCKSSFVVRMANQRFCSEDCRVLWNNNFGRYERDGYVN
jgi:hypothetical protein